MLLSINPIKLDLKDTENVFFCYRLCWYFISEKFLMCIFFQYLCELLNTTSQLILIFTLHLLQFYQGPEHTFMLLSAGRSISVLVQLLPVVVLNTRFEVPESLDILTVIVVALLPPLLLSAKA